MVCLFEGEGFFCWPSRACACVCVCAHEKSDTHSRVRERWIEKKECQGEEKRERKGKGESSKNGKGRRLPIGNEKERKDNGEMNSTVDFRPIKKYLEDNDAMCVTKRMKKKKEGGKTEP